MPSLAPIDTTCRVNHYASDSECLPCPENHISLGGAKDISGCLKCPDTMEVTPNEAKCRAAENIEPWIDNAKGWRIWAPSDHTNSKKAVNIIGIKLYGENDCTGPAVDISGSLIDSGHAGAEWKPENAFTENTKAWGGLPDQYNNFFIGKMFDEEVTATCMAVGFGNNYMNEARIQAYIDDKWVNVQIWKNIRPGMITKIRWDLMPTFSPSPSTMPSLAPIDTTSLPSIATNFALSLKPSLDVSLVPTVTSSIVPTFELSSTPIVLKSSAPTLIASDIPTVVGSSGPIPVSPSFPTIVESHKPSLLVSDKPTLIASDAPTDVGSSAPISMPSSFPTIVESDKPSLLVSDKPTLVLSVDPTLLVSNEPTVFSSVDQTISPSSKPTSSLSEEPTPFSTNRPKLSPSSKPIPFPFSRPIPSATAPVIPTKKHMDNLQHYSLRTRPPINKASPDRSFARSKDVFGKMSSFVKGWNIRKKFTKRTKKKKRAFK